MSTQKAKFELFSRLQSLGFTYNEAASLRRIEMTLSRWAERECGDGSDWAIERDDATGKPYNVYHGEGKSRRYAIADRETGALRRCAAIVAACNARRMAPGSWAAFNGPLSFYHQGDCRGCMLYILRPGDVPAGSRADSCYTNGVAVCC